MPDFFNSKQFLMTFTVKFYSFKILILCTLYYKGEIKKKAICSKVIHTHSQNMTSGCPHRGMLPSLDLERPYYDGNKVALHTTIPYRFAFGIFYIFSSLFNQCISLWFLTNEYRNRKDWIYAIYFFRVILARGLTYARGMLFRRKSRALLCLNIVSFFWGNMRWYLPRRL